MATTWMLLRAVGFPSAPYAYRRRNLQAGEVVRAGNDPLPQLGRHPQVNLNWRILQILNAPEDLPVQALDGNGGGLIRTRIVLLTDPAFASINIREMPDPTAAGLNGAQSIGLITRFPGLSSIGTRQTFYDLEMDYSVFAPLFVDKPPEPSPGVEPAAPIPDQALNPYEYDDQMEQRVNG